MKKYTKILALMLVLSTTLLCLSGCNFTDTRKAWVELFDIDSPTLEGAGTSEETANKDGWYVTLNDDFDGNSLPDHWNPVGNCLRKTEWWCDKYVSVENGNVVVKARHETNHVCENCKATSGNFTSGIITCRDDNGTRIPLFQQAFGYFEARVKVPNSDGMWSAFWLQTLSIRQIGNRGMDGSEIDIYESSFFRNRSTVGSCIHWDGYKAFHHSVGATHDVGVDTYDGYHTYALKWTPNEYVFYFDGKPTWATNAGDVCRVPAFIMLTNEIRDEGVYGPYGQKLGKFKGGDFYIDYVKVYQNVNYLPYVQAPEDFE